MKPLSLNLASMKKVGGDEHSSTFQHEKGHTIIVAHNALPSMQRKQLVQMPIHKFAFGGAGADDAGSPQSQYDNQVANTLANQNETARIMGAPPAPPMEAQNLAQTTLQNQASDETVKANQGQEDQIALAKSQAEMRGTPIPDNIKALADAEALSKSNAAMPDNADTSSVVGNGASRDLPDYGKPIQQANFSPGSGSGIPTGGGFNLQGAYNQGQNAITEQQKVSSALAASDAATQQKDIEQRQALDAGFKQNLSDMQTAQKNSADYITNHPIDPKHYMENMSTGSKVATAIGLIFGGFKQGMMGGNNPAADWLNGQISRDIEGQKARQGQNNTLFEHNQQLFGDESLANNATRMNLNDIYDKQIQLAASKLGTPQAKATADAMHSKFALENAQLLQQNAIRGTVLHSIQANGGQGLDAIDLAHAGFLTPEQAEKEQSSLDGQKKDISIIKDLYGRANKEQTAGNLLNPQSYKRTDAINSEITNVLMSNDASKRLTPVSYETEIKPNLIKTTDDQQTRQMKLQTVLNSVKNHAVPTPMMQKYAPGSMPQYGIAQQQAPQASHKVGDVVNIRGKGHFQIVDAKGTLKPLQTAPVASTQNASQPVN